MIAEEDDGDGGGDGELTAGSLRTLNRRSEELERLLVQLGVKFQTSRCRTHTTVSQRAGWWHCKSSWR
jgi:hypothetical protein